MGYACVWYPLPWLALPAAPSSSTAGRVAFPWLLTLCPPLPPAFRVCCAGVVCRRQARNRHQHWVRNANAVPRVHANHAHRRGNNVVSRRRRRPPPHRPHPLSLSPPSSCHAIRVPQWVRGRCVMASPAPGQACPAFPERSECGPEPPSPPARSQSFDLHPEVLALSVPETSNDALLKQAQRAKADVVVRLVQEQLRTEADRLRDLKARHAESPVPLALIMDEVTLGEDPSACGGAANLRARHLFRACCAPLTPPIHAPADLR